uniref:Potassium channel domain-containing protein n=1 Tax=Setaria digitata TaxID=48799 RepID=A0A915Q7P1_9BILA
MYEIFHWLQRAYQKFHLNNLLPFVILISYTLIGAAIFRNLELERDLRERELFRKNYHYAFDQITKRMIELRCDDNVIKNDKALQMKYAREAVHWFLDYMNFTDVIHERNASTPWSWYGSMFYAGQLYTTIGYGLPVAKTLAGQIASIFYIMFGIPIFLIILKDVGRLLSKTFRKFYKRSRSTGRKFMESLKKMSISVKTFYDRTYLPSTTGSLHSLSVKEAGMDPEGGTLTRQNKKKFNHENAFSIPIALAMLILWIGFSAALFCLYEPEWGYLTSVYFFFVSISTVGLGDIVPGNKDMMLGYFLLILIGLALLSMCINLIQVALERILGQLLQEYIEEIERVAAIAKNETDFEKLSHFEIGMASGLLTVPLDKQYKAMRSLPSRVKDWIAEHIANNMIESQLAEIDSDMESEAEIPAPFQQQEPQHQLPSCRVNPEEMQSSRAALRGGDLIDYLWKHIPAIRTVQALEKAKFYTPNDDFQSVLFSKFVRNSKLERIMDQVCETMPRTCHVTTQTDFINPPNIAFPDKEIYFHPDSQDSSLAQPVSTCQSNYSLSNGFDAESVLSEAFGDIQFTEACALLAISDDSNSTTSIVSNRVPQISSIKALKWKSKWRHLPRRLRAKSYHGTISSPSDDSSTTPLLHPSSNNRHLHSRSYRRIGSLPSCFRCSSFQSNPLLFSRKRDEDS